MLERCAVPVTTKKTSDFKATDIEQDLSRLLGSLEQHLSTPTAASASVPVSVCDFACADLQVYWNASKASAQWRV